MAEVERNQGLKKIDFVSVLWSRELHETKYFIAKAKKVSDWVIG